MAARRGAAINGRLSPEGMMLVPGLVDSEPLSDEVTAVVQCAPAVRIVSRDEKSLEDWKSLESLGGGRPGGGGKLDICYALVVTVD